MRRGLLVGLAFSLVVCSGWATAGLSGNLVGGGDFENTSYLVNETTPDGILPHRFSQTYDLSKWIAQWGPLTNPGSLGGFSTYDNPRNLAETGGNSQPTSGLGNFNRSVDPLNPNNHIMEAVMFRPSMTQWIAAPANQKPGPMSFSYDFLMMDGYAAYYNWGNVFVYGMNYLPPNDVTFFRNAEPGAPGATESVYDPALNPNDGAVLYRNLYGEWIHGSTNGIDPPFQYYNTWQHYDTDEYLENEEGSPIEPDGTPDYQWWGDRVITTNLTETYAYYVIAVYPLVYDEGDPFFWLENGRISEGFVYGFDNFDLRVSVQIRCDFNGDGAVTLSDINPFKLALTDTPGWQAQYPDIPLALVDPNDDGVITLSDINAFKAALTGGTTMEVPEPGSFSLLIIGALALGRRRR